MDDANETCAELMSHTRDDKLDALISAHYTGYVNRVHPDKRTRTLLHRGLDFGDAAEVFADLTYTRADARFDYGEQRAITIGTLEPMGCAGLDAAWRSSANNFNEVCK